MELHQLATESTEDRVRALISELVGDVDAPLEALVEAFKVGRGQPSPVDAEAMKDLQREAGLRTLETGDVERGPERPAREREQDR